MAGGLRAARIGARGSPPAPSPHDVRHRPDGVVQSDSPARGCRPRTCSPPRDENEHAVARIRCFTRDVTSAHSPPSP